MARLGLVVAGAGYFCAYHLEAWRRIPEVAIKAIVYASNRSRAEARAREYDIPQVFDKLPTALDSGGVDLVDIVSTPESHLSLITESCARTIPTITQKPLAPTLDDSVKISSIALASSTLVVVHENWRFKPWFREIKAIVAAGRIGRVLGAVFRVRPGDGQGPEAYLGRQPYFRCMPRFLMHETGIHVIDVFRYLFGEIDAVTARLRRLNPVIAGEDAGYVIFEFSNGLHGLLDGNRHVDHVTSDIFRTMGEVIVDGTDGVVTLTGEGRIFVRAKGSREDVEHAYDWSNRGYAGDCVYTLQRHVVEHLLNGSPIENEVQSYMPNIALVEAVYRSAAEGRRVERGEIAVKP